MNKTLRDARRIAQLETALLIAIEHLDPKPIANELRAALAKPRRSR